VTSAAFKHRKVKVLVNSDYWLSYELYWIRMWFLPRFMFAVDSVVKYNIAQKRGWSAKGL